MSSLKCSAASGIRWTTLSTVITTALQFIQIAVLGRLLDPTAFGLMAIITIVVGFAQLFGQMGISEALIQRKDPTASELSSLYWLNIASGVIVFVIVWIVTPLIAKGFSAPELKFLLPWIAITFAIAPFGTQFQALMQKSLRFKILAGVEITYMVINVFVSIVAAWWGLGVWSIVWGNLIASIFRTGILMRYGWNRETKPQFYFCWSEVAGYINFGFYRVGAMSVNYLNSRTDQLFIGILFGPQILGYYSMAANLVLMPIQKINPLMTRVAFPVFSQIQGDLLRLQRGYLQMISLLMLVNAPILLGLAAVAPIMVPLFIGEQWKVAVPSVQVLAFYALIRSLGNASGCLILGCGRADWMLYWNLVLLLIAPPIIYLGSLIGGVVYVTWILVALQALLFIANYLIFIRNLIGSCFLKYLKALGIPTLLASLMIIVIIAINPLLQALPNLLHLSIQVLVGILAYGMLVWLFQRQAFNNLRNVLPKTN
jgi:O-antigen/teichoic acid export membrane protein